MMDFGKALEALKSGKKVSRKGWNGKGMFAVYQKGYPQGIPCNKQTADAWGLNEGDLFKVRPYLQLKTAQGDHAMWNPSTSDVLAEDWEVVEEQLTDDTEGYESEEFNPSKSDRIKKLSEYLNLLSNVPHAFHEYDNYNAIKEVTRELREELGLQRDEPCEDSPCTS